MKHKSSHGLSEEGVPVSSDVVMPCSVLFCNIDMYIFDKINLFTYLHFRICHYKTYGQWLLWVRFCPIGESLLNAERIINIYMF